MTQALNIDNARIVMAPGAGAGPFWPIGAYVAQQSWASEQPRPRRRFRTAMNQSLAYAQSHPERDPSHAAGRDAERPAADLEPADRPRQARQLAKYTHEYGVISTLPNLTQLVPSSVASGKTLQGTVGNRFIVLRLDGKPVDDAERGPYTFVVSDQSTTQNFVLSRPGREQGDERQGDRPQHLDGDAPRRAYTFMSSNRGR